MSYENLVRTAMDKVPFDMVIEHTNLVNVYTGEIYTANIGICGSRISYVGEPGKELRSNETIDAGEKYAVPGLIDSHLHIESSMITPPRFAEAVLPHGVTTVAIDPHEIANVLGRDGVRMLLESSKNLPLKVYILVPTCVPAVQGVESSGAEFYSDDIAEMLEWERVIGLAEVMDYSGVIHLDKRITEIVKAGLDSKVVLDGHCVSLRDRELNAYVSTGIEADHENFTFEDVVEKTRLGMYAKLRKSILSEDFVNRLKDLPDRGRILFVTDDVMPDELVENGHLDDVLRTAIQRGFDPLEAIQSATLKPALHLRLFERGAIAPGKVADIVLVKNLEQFKIDTVFAGGRVVARDGRVVVRVPLHRFPERARRLVKIEKPRIEDFFIRTRIKEGRVKVRVIKCDGLATTFKIEEVDVRDRVVQTEELATVVVLERHGRTRGKSIGLITGFGISTGAVASTVSHDSHNLVVVGMDPSDMHLAVNKLIESQGGIVVVNKGEVLSLVELPIAGLMSEEPIEHIAEQVRSLRRAEKTLGIKDYNNIPLIFTLALPVIPSARITDKELFDVRKQRFTSLFVNS